MTSSRDNLTENWDLNGMLGTKRVNEAMIKDNKDTGKERVSMRMLSSVCKANLALMQEEEAQAEVVFLSKTHYRISAKQMQGNCLVACLESWAYVNF